MNRLKKYVASLDSYQSDKFVERTVDELNKFVKRLPDGYYTLARRFTNNPITPKVFIRLKKQMHSDWGLLDRYAEFKETSLEERAEWMVRAHGLLGLAYYNATLSIIHSEDDIYVYHDRPTWLKLCEEIIRMIAAYDEDEECVA